MPDRENLFKDFPPTSKKEWLAKIEKDLKGRSFTDLIWHLSESTPIDPFYHPDDKIVVTGPLIPTNSTQNNWEIGEYILIGDSFSEANQHALTALNGGAEALLFQCGAQELNDANIALLLHDIELNLISVHFEFSTKEGLENSFSTLKKLAQWRGALHLTAAQIEMPLFSNKDQKVHTLIADGRKYYQDTAHTADELAQMLFDIFPVFSRVAEETSPSTANERVKLLLAIDTSYFVAIAKIRALKILWANFIQAFGVHPSLLPEIEVHLTPYPTESDPNTNMIRSATQTLSAAIGGANRIFVTPADSQQGQSTDFTRRIARNVQHLLKMESYIDRVIDPAAGSYYIEKLTGALAEKAWKKFQQLAYGSSLGT